MDSGKLVSHVKNIDKNVLGIENHLWRLPFCHLNWLAIGVKDTELARGNSYDIFAIEIFFYWQSIMWYWRGKGGLGSLSHIWVVRGGRSRVFYQSKRGSTAKGEGKGRGERGEVIGLGEREMSFYFRWLGCHV